jgi:hypothetical protein
MTGWRKAAHNIILGILIAIGGAALGLLVVVNWVEKQILTTDNWVALVSPLPKQPVVSNALATYISGQVFSAAPIEQEISQALPPKAGFLAGPLTDQLKTLTTNVSRRVVTSDGFQVLWAGANRTAMNRLVSTARGQPTPLQSRLHQKFNLNLSNSSGQLRGALGSAASAIPALQPASQKAIGVSVDLQAKTQKIHQVVRTLDYLQAVLPWLVSASLLYAVALSLQRRRTVATAALVAIFTFLIGLILIKAARGSVVGQVKHANNVPAVSFIFDTLSDGLRNSFISFIVLASGVILICFALGPARWAKSLQSLTHIKRLQQHNPMLRWRAFRRWLAPRQYYACLAATLLVVACVALFMTVNSRVVTNALLLAISLWALIHIVATPRTVQKA